MSTRIKFWKFLIILVVLAITIFLILKFGVYKVKYDNYVKNAISVYSSKDRIDTRLIQAIMKETSGFNEKKVNKDKKGITQIDENAFNEIKIMRGYDAGEDIMDVETNINVCVIYLDLLLDRYDDNIYLALLAYNAGYSNVDVWIQANQLSDKINSSFVNTPNKDANKFLASVMSSFDMYKKLH